MIFHIECDRGCRYSQEVERKTEQPIYCGVCGCRAIRVWELVCDSLSPVIRERLEAPNHRSNCQCFAGAACTCGAIRRFHIPTAQEVEACARVLGPMHEAEIDGGVE